MYSNTLVQQGCQSMNVRTSGAVLLAMPHTVYAECLFMKHCLVL